MHHLKWRIKNATGLYVTLPQEEVGTVIMSNDISASTVIGPCTKDYVDGYCAGLSMALDDNFCAVPAVHVEQPKTESA